MSSDNQWTVERALNEGRADLLMRRDGKLFAQSVGRSRITDHFRVVFEDGTALCYPDSGSYRLNVDRPEPWDLVLRPQPEPDGPPRDWPAIWRQQLREHIERAPMIPREYVQEVICAVDFYVASKGISQIVRKARNNGVTE